MKMLYVSNASGHSTISWICKLSRNRSSISKWSRLQISLLCNVDNLFSIFPFVIGACAFTGAAKTHDSKRQQDNSSLKEANIYIYIYIYS